MFNKNNTRVVKGMAMLFMLAHHLFFRKRMMCSYTSNILIDNQDLLFVFSEFCRICVALFMFVGGIGLFHKFSKEDYSLLNDIKNLYSRYLLVFVIFVPIGFLFCNKQPDYFELSNLCHIFDISNFSFGSFFATLIGWNTAYNYEWWFLKTYCFSSIIGCIYLSIFSRKNNLYIELFVIVIFQILTSTFFLDLCFIDLFDNLKVNILYQNIFTIDGACSSFLMGILFAKYNMAAKLSQKLSSLRKGVSLICSIVLLVLLMFSRQFVFGEQLDFILCIPIVLIGKNISDEGGICSKFLSSVGKCSPFMWLTHSFYCYYFYDIVKLVNMSKNIFVAYFTLFLLSYFTAFLLERIFNYVRVFFNRVLYRKI